MCLLTSVGTIHTVQRDIFRHSHIHIKLFLKKLQKEAEVFSDSVAEADIHCDLTYTWPSPERVLVNDGWLGAKAWKLRHTIGTRSVPG